MAVYETAVPADPIDLPTFAWSQATLRRLRLAMGLTQRVFAARLDLSLGEISTIESGGKEFPTGKWSWQEDIAPRLTALAHTWSSESGVSLESVFDGLLPRMVCDGSGCLTEWQLQGANYIKAKEFRRLITEEVVVPHRHGGKADYYLREERERLRHHYQEHPPTVQPKTRTPAAQKERDLANRRLRRVFRDLFRAIDQYERVCMARALDTLPPERAED